MSSELELWDSARSKQVLSPGPGDLWFRRGGELGGESGQDCNDYRCDAV